MPTGLGFENRLNFEQKRAGFSLFGSYPFKIWNRVRLELTASNNSQTSAINPATRGLLQRGADAGEPILHQHTGGSFSNFHARKLIPSLQLQPHQMVRRLNPSRDQSLSTTFEFTGGPLGGNVNYYRPTLEYRYFHPMNKGRNTLAFRFLGSYVQRILRHSRPVLSSGSSWAAISIFAASISAQISPIAYVVRQHRT